MTTEQLIDRISKVAQSGDWVGVQRLVADLKRLMTEEGRPLAGPAVFSLVEALSNGSATAVGSGPSPYVVAAQIKSICDPKRTRPGQIDMTALQAAWETLYAILASSSTSVEPGAVREVVKNFLSARAFDFAAKTADRALVHAPDDGDIRCAYGQALIDSGRIHAGIDMLNSVLSMKVAAKSDRDRAMGLLGRAHKQLYVDHVSSSTTPPSVRQRFRPLLEKSIAAYATVYDAARAGENYWPGVNLVALLSLAREDGHRDIKNPTGLEPEEIARRIVAALEPQAASTSESWVLATLGEAYLGLRDYEKAAKYLGDYARDDSTDDFKLEGTVRQLEQVWRIRAGHDKAGAILAVIKAAQMAKPEGKFTLNGDELKGLRSFAASPEYTYTETMVTGGSFMKLAELQRIVGRAASVAAMCDENGKTMGTGFVVRGGDLLDSLGDDLYLLTNAHVMSEPNRKGSEPRSLHPARTRVKLEAAEGSELKFDPQVIWQSPVAEYDACLVKLLATSAQVKPLPIVAPSLSLKVEDTEQRVDGTNVSVIGHPLGGPLSLSLVGTLSGANGVLVDAGPRATPDGDPSYLHYRAPTEPGNSGSPVFETGQWTVVALHHMGFDQFEGRPRLKGKAGSQFANEGISIQSIRKALAADLKPERRGGVLGRVRGSS